METQVRAVHQVHGSQVSPLLWPSLSALPLGWLCSPPATVQAGSPLETPWKEEGGELLGETGRHQERAGGGDVSLEE